MLKDALEETEVKLEPVDEEAEATWILQFFARGQIQPEFKTRRRLVKSHKVSLFIRMSTSTTSHYVL